jgi:hypothetical protein
MRKISCLAELTLELGKKNAAPLSLLVTYYLVQCGHVLFANRNTRSNICIILQRSLLLVKEQLHYYFLRSTFSNFEQLYACFIIILISTTKKSAYR